MIGRAAVAGIMASILASPASAEVWMVKSPNVIACQHSQTLIDLDAAPASHHKTAGMPAGCITLYSGERLLEQPRLAQGFSKYLEVEREDGAIWFVRSADVVADPGIGSVDADR